MTLQDINTKINVRLEQAVNPSASRDILTLLRELVEVLQANAGPDPKDATIAKLKSDLAGANSLLNNDAAIFAAIKTALGKPDLTQGELPQRAADVFGVLTQVGDILKFPKGFIIQKMPQHAQVLMDRLETTL